MKMSPNRRLSAVYRKEQREIRACPYRRSEEESEKEKKSSRVRQPSLFSHYLPLIPTQWSGYLDYLNIFNYFGSSKRKEKEEVHVVVVPEEDFVMTDSEATTTSTEESSSDSSIEITEVADSVEPVAPVESSKTTSQSTWPVDPSFTVPTSKNVSLEESTSFAPYREPTPPQSLAQRSTCSSGVPSAAAVPPVFENDDELLDWVKRKADARETMNGAEFLGLKSFFERTRGECTYEPIKLRFTPRGVPPLKTATHNASLVNATSSQKPTVNSTSTTSTEPTASTDGPTHWSAFHSSTGLPTFKNNSLPSRPRMLKRAPITPVCAFLEESRKRSAPLPLPRLDPYKRRRLLGQEKASTVTEAPRSQTASSNAVESSSSVPPRVPRCGINRQHITSQPPSPPRSFANGSPLSSPRRQNAMPTNLNASSSRGTRSTYSAAFVQEIVEKTPPRPRYSDVVNPYQTAAPIKPLSRPMEKKKMSERRAKIRELERQREAAKAKDSEKKELSAKEIIEATIPKGAKRSRPPPGLARSKPIATFDPVVMNKRSLEDPQEELVTKKRRTVTVEEVSDDDDAASRSVPVKPNVIIESRSPSPEPAQDPTHPHAKALSPTELSSKEPLANAVSAFSTSTKEQSATVTSTKDSTPKSIVKEVTPKVPSMKESSPRVPHTKEPSVKVPSTKVPSSKAPANHFTPLLKAGKSSVPREPSKLRTSFLPDDYENEEPKVPSPTPATPVEMTAPGTPLADIQEKKDPKEVALTLPLNELPPYVFKSPPAITAVDHMDARIAVKELPITSLPKFDFSKARTSMNLPAVPIPTIKPFDFNAAGIKPPTSASNGQWKCSTCMLQNPITAIEKCTVCDSPRLDTEEPKEVMVNGVNGVGGANGLNGVGDSTSKSTSAPVVKAFDFAAAGFKPRPVADGQWTCSTCMLQNPPTVVDKCKICDSPRPGMEKVEKPKKPYMNGAAHSPSSQANGVSTPATKPFDFAAAGMKPPAPPSNGNWKCPTCMLENPATAIEKCKICDSPRPGTEKKAVEVPVKPSVPVVTKPFDWAAAGMAPPKMNGNSWTCGTCMLSNPSTETEKCKVCDASRS